MSAPEPIEVLFSEYVAAQRAGDFDPRPFLDRADPADREVLVEMIDYYLSRAPGRKWDAEAFETSQAKAMVEPMARALTGVSGTWPVLLPSLRHNARLRRSEVVSRLAEGLGFPKKARPIADYYHQMEQGDLPAEGVSPTVLSVLAGIYGTGTETLRRAGQAIGEGDVKGKGAVYARKATFSAEDAQYSYDASGFSEAANEPLLDKDDLTIQRLFTGEGAER